MDYSWAGGMKRKMVGPEPNYSSGNWNGNKLD
jgi:hypothetical protein